ncbi:MAG TPA: Holliday junction resolvase RuvX [Planctomycetota bacterium]
MTTPKRILAIDFGERRTGLAATDWTGTIVVPLPRIEASDEAAVIAAIVEVVEERATELVVLGMPFASDGGLGQRAQRTAAFRDRLQAALPCPLATQDESNSTDEAHSLLKQGGLKASRRKELADSTAALVILERYRAEQRRN